MSKSLFKKKHEASEEERFITIECETQACTNDEVYKHTIPFSTSAGVLLMDACEILYGHEGVTSVFIYPSDAEGNMLD